MLIKKYISPFLIVMNVTATAATSQWQITFKGIGPIEVGMTLKKAQQVGRIQFMNHENTRECYMAKPKGIKGLSFMVIEGRIARIDVTSPYFSTAQGVKVGDSESKVKAVYNNQLEIEPHKYNEQGRYLTVYHKADHTAIRFDTNKQTIVEIHSGGENEVYLVEGCL